MNLQTIFFVFVRIKFREFHQKDILPFAVNFCIRLKKTLFAQFENLRYLLELNFLNSTNWQLPSDFSRT